MLGIVTDKISNNSQNYFMFKCLNQLSKDMECSVFTNELESLPMQNEFGIFAQVYALEFSGDLMSTSVFNTQIVANSLMARNKYFYLQNIEWTEIGPFHINQIFRTLFNEEIKIITRGPTHRDVVNKLFQQTDLIVPEWDAEEIKRIVTCH
jgi:hypothetical protein